MSAAAYVFGAYAHPLELPPSLRRQATHGDPELVRAVWRARGAITDVVGQGGIPVFDARTGHVSALPRGADYDIALALYDAAAGGTADVFPVVCRLESGATIVRMPETCAAGAER